MPDILAALPKDGANCLTINFYRVPRHFPVVHSQRFFSLIIEEDLEELDRRRKIKLLLRRQSIRVLFHGKLHSHKRIT